MADFGQKTTLHQMSSNLHSIEYMQKRPVGGTVRPYFVQMVLIFKPD